MMDKANDHNRVLVVGAGFAGKALLRDILHGNNSSYEVIGFIDDDERCHGKSIHGVNVFGGVSDLQNILTKQSVDVLVIAIPSLRSVTLFNAVLDVCHKFNVKVMTLPSLHHISNDHVSTDILRDVNIDDLLGRAPVDVVSTQITGALYGKTIMVTGGGGSIGSELCKQIAMNKPGCLLIVDFHEFNLYTIEQEIREQFPDLAFHAFLIDVADQKNIRKLIKGYQPSVIFHAAALKHVPIVENNALAAIRTNVLATQTMADIASEMSVGHFVLISTDKSVNPTSIMGLSKRLGEIYCQNINKMSATQFITVRFGNVLGSTGSVIPLFKKQLQKGGPITITDRRMMRFFMTIREASSLILQSFLIGKGGDIFVLDMGEQIKIKDLAEKMIRLSGKVPYKDIDIIYTGLRPGEKLSEALFHQHEVKEDTSVAKVFKAKCREHAWAEVCNVFNAILVGVNKDSITAVLSAAAILVPEYANNTSHASVNVANEEA